MLTSIDFKKEFLIDFDNILTQTNNPLINSDEHYLQYKQNYLKTAKENMKRFEDLCNAIKELQQTQQINVSYCKFQYTYIQENELSTKKEELKKILTQQRKALNNFLAHIQFLNNNSSKFPASTHKNTLKDLFNKVFN